MKAIVIVTYHQGPNIRTTAPDTVRNILYIYFTDGCELFSKFTDIGRYDFMDAVASVNCGTLGMIPAGIGMWLL